MSRKGFFYRAAPTVTGGLGFYRAAPTVTGGLGFYRAAPTVTGGLGFCGLVRSLSVEKLL